MRDLTSPVSRGLPFAATPTSPASQRTFRARSDTRCSTAGKRRTTELEMVIDLEPPGDGCGETTGKARMEGGQLYDAAIRNHW
jgi:hypothetical protein